MDYAPVFDFEARQQGIDLRKRRLAEMIRNQAQFQQDPGRMVSGHYVAPSWAQSLNQAVAPVMDRRNIQAEEQGLLRDTAEFSAADRRAAIEHAMARPQATPEQAGPVDPSNPTELQARQPTQADMAQWAQKGMGIPSRRGVIEKVLADIEVNEPIRQEQREFRKEESAANRQARREEHIANLQARAEDLRIRMEDRNLDRASREQMARESRALQAEIARGNQELRRLQIERGLEKDKEPKPGKTLPAGTVKDLGELDERAATLSSLTSSFKPEYAGPMAAAKGKVAPYVPGMDAEGANWWRDYKKQQELVERHSLFGATLTQGEQDAWRAADISPSMQPAVIQKNLATRAKLADKVAAKALERYGAAGYNVEGLGRVRSTGGASGEFDASPGKALQVRKFNPATGRLE